MSKAFFSLLFLVVTTVQVSAAEPDPDVPAEATVMFNFARDQGLASIQPTTFIGFDKKAFQKGKGSFNVRLGPAFAGSGVAATSPTQAAKNLLLPGSFNFYATPYFSYAPRKSLVLSLVSLAKFVGTTIDVNSNDSNWSFQYGGSVAGEWNACGTTSNSKCVAIMFQYRHHINGLLDSKSAYRRVLGTRDIHADSVGVSLQTSLGIADGLYFQAEYRKFVRGEIADKFNGSEVLSVGISKEISVIELASNLL